MRSQRVGLADVARAAGVSEASVSRLLNADPGLKIRQDTRERILRAVDELGYRANVNAQALRRRKSGVIGLALHDLSSTVAGGLLVGAGRRAAERGVLLLTGDADELAASPQMMELYFGGGRLDGLMVQGGYRDMGAGLAEVGKDLKVVTFNVPGSDSVPGIRLSERDAGFAAARHLIELGHSRIGYVGGVEGSFTGVERRSGVVAAHDEAGLQFPRSRTRWADWTAEGGARALREFLQGSTHDVTAIVAANALVGIGAMRAALEIGIRVPDDLSIVAIQDTWTAPYLAPALTTIAMPLEELGKKAVDMLLAVLAGEPVPSDTLIASPGPVLQLRESTMQRKG